MEEEKKEIHEHHETHEHKKNLTEKIRENPWILSSLVLGSIAILLLSIMFFGNITGNVVSAKTAGQKVLAFYSGIGIEGLSLASVEEISGVYQINLNYQGKVVPIYLTKDGKNIIESLTSIEPTSSSDTTQTEVPKTEKPSVELYVFTYCPYGLQMEKAILPVIDLLGNKIDFKIRQIGAMHGEYEEIEAKRQLCVEQEYPDKFLAYIKAFAEDTEIGSCNGDATCLTPKLNALYTKLGITTSKITSCMNTDGDKLYAAEEANSQAKGASGSPTLIINGVTVSSSRSPEAVKGVICNAFSEVPAECSAALSNEQASPGFGAGTSSSSSTASC